ncbi:putative ATPase [Blastococcus colisei]|uniref:Putative ATPase n=1 Tax=Blastococcus colisei TaxID=1564162 RepID=A0A543PCZ2_9ACTN|nr:BTAD domain-containing putative transcriptional regulator [Blastococcus colisei]TQN41958.1 putative ATPase [Blastococcus colisei]
MEIRVLGPVEVLTDGVPHPVPAAGERELLTLLALSAGRVVAASALIDALWGEDLPGNPDNALQVRVSKLRRAFAGLGLPAGLIATRRPGYVLEVDPSAVDAIRFSGLITTARSVADDDPARAGDLYREALSLWRGAPFAEFGSAPWAEPDAARLTELQLAAREEVIDLGLAAGRHGDVIADLEALTAAHPLRERLHSRLMLALYRAGRQAEALAAYQRARDALAADLGLEPGAELRSLQQAILQQRPDLGAPERVPAPRQAPPPPSAVRRLPLRLTSFLGRNEDLQRVAGLLHRHRLITVIGPGGVGKTSLALEVARTVAGGFPDGIGVARLAGVVDPVQVPDAVLTALDVREAPTTTAEEQLIGHLRDRAVLVVLDNCEHLVDACAVLAEHLLESCPQLRILATSREPLAARGEVQYAVDPLPVPPPDPVAGEVAASTAVRLFVDRAQNVLPDFHLDHDNAGAVAEICRHLDGIPLAIELAAARVASLPVSQLADRMEDRFAVLTSGPRTAEARQRTLRATVDWSYDLLTDPERVLLSRLSIFRGTWTIDAVRAIAGDDLPPNAVVDTLARLVDRSLVVVDRDAGPRYHLLETIREYARHRLSEGGDADRIGRAHVGYLTDLAERAERELRGDGQSRWLPRLALERDDIEAALAWCTAHADVEPDVGLRLVGALGWYWYFASRPDGGSRVAAMLAAAPGGSAAARARALQALAVAGRTGACIVHPAAECAAAAAESRILFAELGDDFRAALSTTLLAVEGIGSDDPAPAFALLADADQEFSRAEDAWCAALVRFVEMELLAAGGAMTEAVATGNRALATFRALGDQWGVSAIQFHLGMALHRAGSLEDALAMYEGALTSGRAVGGPVNTIQYALAGVGHVRLLLGDAEGAARSFAESHQVGQELGTEGNARAAVGDGLLARELGDLELARIQLGRAQQLLAGQSEPDWTATALVGLGHLAELGGDLGTAESFHRRAWQAAPGRAAALEGLACVAAARGEGVDAAGLLGAATWWRQRRHRPPSKLELVDVDRAEHAARSLMGDDAFETAFRSGASSPHTVVRNLEHLPATC